MQFNIQDDGSGVIHKITGNFKGKVSAYYGPNGVLEDAEIIRGERSYPVKRNGPIWKHCENLGRIYMKVS